MEYKFEPSQLPEISLHVLLEMFAFQQATILTLGEMFADEKLERIMSEINEQTPVLKERILEQLYTAFGQTPKV